MRKLKLDNRTTVEIPSTPNFIKCGDNVEPISRFTTEELRLIGKEWIEELVIKARSRRTNPNHHDTQHK